jgi:hypothetical protein
VPPLVCIQSLFVRLLLIRQPDNTMASTTALEDEDDDEYEHDWRGRPNANAKRG